MGMTLPVREAVGCNYEELPLPFRAHGGYAQQVFWHQGRPCTEVVAIEKPNRPLDSILVEGSRAVGTIEISIADVDRYVCLLKR